jgi:hypothetical protein
MGETITIDGKEFDAAASHADFTWHRFSDTGTLLGLAAFRELRAASFGGANLDDRGLELVCRISTIDTLDLQDTEVTNEGLVSLGRLERLDYLRLKDNQQLTNDCVQHLVSLPLLENLAIQETSIDERGLWLLKGKRSLRDLCLDVFEENFSLEGLRRWSAATPGCTVIAKGRGEFVAGVFDGEWERSRGTLEH